MNRKLLSALLSFSILATVVSLSFTANAATCSLSIKSIDGTNPLTVTFTDTVTMTGNSSWNTLSPHVVFNGQDTNYGPLSAGPYLGPGTFSQDYIIVFNAAGT